MTSVAATVLLVTVNDVYAEVPAAENVAKIQNQIRRNKGTVDDQDIDDAIDVMATDREIDMDLAKLVFSYPKDINKTISLCYNLIKDSYYLKEDKTFVSVPKDKIDSSKEELLLIWEANKDKTKKKFVKK